MANWRYGIVVDERIMKTAQLLVDYSTRTKKGDRVLIQTDTLAKDLALEVYKYALVKGAHPWIRTDLPGVSYTYYKYASEDQLAFFPEHELAEIKSTDVYILLWARANLKELSGIDPSKISARQGVLGPILEWRIEKTRWVVFVYPTESSAQEAEMSLPEFEDFVYKACLIDWKDVSKKLNILKKHLDAADRIEFTSPDTHLEFSVKGRKSIAGYGEKNMPDGELFTSVVEESVNGTIGFDIPGVLLYNVTEGINLTFKEGKVIEAKADKNQKFMERILATDEGAKRIGEFGIGFNYGITRSVKNALFDEKIGGTAHLALGLGYKDTLSRNESAIHWDLIKDFRKGGEIRFDGKVVMKDGKWLIA
jgi:aminopeptidase